ncbi:ankyrin repeat, PH and SEC7 domain containing protein secG isoform X1 [Lucilia sericata]|uniref:ankyrin repeat, PH and SEC7 domain containing protein secG isoform X1 n=2 Tax=Lucilia sericata TaxID=13632 RepID=UPI0018A7F983|nr:ankyrin repeat, PH and SEC7 domain containing protein secG isoform X1 [Lucilia sericata]
MHSVFGCSDVNERLLAAVHNGNYEDTLSCLMQGAKATFISYSCGRTAVGLATLMGDPEILQLLIQSCEEPDLEIFHQGASTTNEVEVDTTPDGMDCLEWEDEFTADADQMNNSNGTTDETIEEFTSLYYYYAKTFERTGDIVSNLENYCCGHNNCNKIIHQDPHTVDHMTMAPLHYAAITGDVECARILLEHGAKVNVTTAVGYTPLHVGANNCDISLLLLKYGANPNAKTFNTGETPFHAALKNRNAAVCQILLQTNKVNINEIDEDDKTVLIYAIAYEQIEAAIELICRGAKVNLQDKDGKTALFYAVEKNNIILASRLLERGARHITSHYLLHQCVAHNMMDMLKLLLCYDDHRNSLKVRNSEGYTPIQIAIINKKSDMLEYMLKLDATSLQLEMDNNLLLAVQSIENLVEIKCILRILFAYANCSVWHKRSSNFMSTSSAGCYTPYCHMPLSRAIMLNKLDIAEFLIKEGIDLQQQICREHVVNHLRTLQAKGYKQLTKLLVLNGFKFPQPKYPSSITNKFSKERQDYEDYIQQLTNQPLELKSLTRIQIRKHLMETFCNSTVELKQNYRATNDKSTLQQMIEQLEIPKILQEYLIDFYDCETVMPLYVLNGK